MKHNYLLDLMSFEKEGGGGGVLYPSIVCMQTAEKIQIGQIATNGNYLLDQMSLCKLIMSLYKILCSVFEKVIGQIMLDAAAEIRGKTIKFYIKEKERDSIDTHIRMYIPVYASIVIEFLLRLKIHKIVTCVSRFYIEKHFFVVFMVNHETLVM